MQINIDEYKEILKTKGYKLTNQRKAILNTIIENVHEHLSCEEIFNLVSVDYPEIGIATIYRTIQLFENLNIVVKVNFDDGFSRYEIKENTNDHHHHHLICLKCGNILEVELDLLESLENTIESQEAFYITDHNVKFYGYCKDCKDL
ncbi:Fur family transcriptional regulator [Tissierella creatinophila]|uniref:Ferric uptake regulation protein n=1 Tax=Tissierella creatinophila DSM 6911 TaxID=1123403 RepID=A0A1U7M9N0_TISCR|nr:Fur family transcriptional regulator [Tissierella creatinophila]OLS03908.1 ferric uptake regulation protein [Tissierella creatinophila DSM 6911]